MRYYGAEAAEEEEEEERPREATSSYCTSYLHLHAFRDLEGPISLAMFLFSCPCMRYFMLMIMLPFAFCFERFPVVPERCP